jgi:hypothetical protein
MTRGRRRLIQFLVLACLLVGVCVLLWVIFHIEPAGPKDYSFVMPAGRELLSIGG